MPDDRDAKERVEELRDAINRHDRLYFVENAPEISDAEYDRKLSELEELEQEHPDLVTEDSPTQRVGAAPVSKLEKVDHVAPMLSLRAVRQEDEIGAFFDRLRDETGRGRAGVLAEPKFDGLSVEVVYKEGCFVRASTRGDGETGEDISHTLRTVRALPLRLDGPEDPPEDLAVRGEAILPKAEFRKLNKARVERGEDPFANPRNAAAGLLRRQDPSAAGESRFSVTFYDATGIGTEVAPTQRALLDRLAALGLPVIGDREGCETKGDAAAFHRAQEKARDDFDFEIDGIVLKLDRRGDREALGTRSRSPRWAIAWKFAPRAGETRITDIVVGVGRTGALTPVALLDPVDVGGVTVARATLHNIAEVHRKDLRVGDIVRIERAGDVIPEVAERVPKPGVERSDTFEMPGRCPSCGARVERRGPRAFCPAGIACPAQVRARLAHYGSRQAMDIEGLGEKTAEQLVGCELVKDIADLYDLTVDDISCLDGFARKSAEALYRAIADRQEVPLDRFLVALGIRRVGRDVARRLARAFGTLDALREASAAEVKEIDGIGSETAQSVAAFFAETRNDKVIDRILEAGVSPQPVDRAGDALEGKTFVLTGALEHWTRAEATEEIERRGGRVTSSVSGATDFVVVGADPGSKRDEAREEGIEMLDEAGFRRVLG